MAALAAASAASGATKCNSRRNIGSHCPRLIGKAWLESAAAPPLAAAADSEDVEKPVLHRKVFLGWIMSGGDNHRVSTKWNASSTAPGSKDAVVAPANSGSPKQHYEPIHCIEFYHEATTGIV